MRLLSITSYLSLIVLTSGALLQAQTTWDGGGIGDDWGTPENWEGDAIPGDTTIARTLNGAATINVTTAVQADYFSNQNADASLVTLNINSGSLTENSNKFTGRHTDGTTTVISVAGGSLLAGADFDVYGPATGTLTYNISAGGVYGYDRFRYASTTINLSGGVLEMGDPAAETVLRFDNSAALNMSATGTFVFDIFGNNTSDTITGSAAVDMSAGIIGFRFADSYTPQIGDSYDFINTATIVVDPTAGNVASSDIDGKYNIVWDKSGWSSATPGALTIQSITAVPEPSTYALLAGGLSLCLLGLRRRR